MLVVTLIAIYLLLVGVLVVIENPMHRVNISLAASIVLTGSWALGVYGLQGDLGSSVMYARIIFALGLLSLVSLLWFISELLDDLKIKTLPNWFFSVYYSIAAVTALLTSTTAFMVSSTARVEGQLPIPIYGSAMWLYALILCISVVVVVYLLLRGYTRARGSVKSQIGAVAATISVSIFVAIMTNLVLPMLTGSSQTALLVLLPVIILLSGLSYLIVKQRLFRIGPYLGRASLYFVVTGALVTIIIVPVLWGVSLLSGANVNSLGFAVLVLVVTVIAVSFSYVGNWFNKATSRIFFRDSYDPAEVLGELNKILVSAFELDTMLLSSLALLNKSLKNEAGAFILIDSSNQLRVIKFGRGNYSESDVEALKVHMNAAHLNTLVIDTLPIAADSLRALLHQKNVSVVLRIITGKGERKRTLGYLVMGGRKSGKPYSRHDVRFLETIVDTVSIAMQNVLHYEETQHFNETLREKVDEATAQLKATNKHLKQMDQTKDEFISLTSHQLRTPLTTIKGYISMLLDGDAGELQPQQRKLLEEAFNSSQRMVHLISDFLNISRIQTGKFMIELADVNLADVLDEEIEQLQISALSRQINLHYDKPADFPTMPLDDGKIRQVMMNFIDNAIYYSPSNSTIHVTLSHTASTVEFKVIDQGIGVPKAEQHKLFAKFSRASNAKRQRPDGTGIGLFMAKKVIVALGGAIIFESEEGKGSTFGFRLNRPKS